MRLLARKIVKILTKKNKYIKKNARVTFRSNRRSNFKRNNNFSKSKSSNKKEKYEYKNSIL